MPAYDKPINNIPATSIPSHRVVTTIAAPTSAPSPLPSTSCRFSTNFSSCDTKSLPTINVAQYPARINVAARGPSPVSPAYVDVHPPMLASLPDSQNSKKPNTSTPGNRATCTTSRHEKPCSPLASGNCIPKNSSAQAPAKPAQISSCSVIGKCPAITAASNGTPSAPIP